MNTLLTTTAVLLLTATTAFADGQQPHQVVPSHTHGAANDYG